MDHKDLIDSVINNMTGKTPVNEPTEVQDPNDIITIYFMNGYELKINIKTVDWGDLANNKELLEENVAVLRRVMYSLVTMDHMSDESDKIIHEYEENINSFMKGFGVDISSYGELSTMSKPYVMTMCKCFDCLNLIRIILNHVDIYELSQQIFNMETLMSQMDVAEMDKSTDGLITEDRENFSSIPDDHDVSGLLEN